MKVAWPSPGTWPVTLRSGALVLRPLDRHDEGPWTELRTTSYAWLTPWDATPPPEAPPRAYTFADMLRNHREAAREARMLPWGLAWDDAWASPSSAVEPVEAKPVRPAPHSRLIGSLTVNGITWGSSRSAYIGYWIDKRWAGRGLVPLGVALAADYCFQTLRLHRLEIDIVPENGPSHRVVEKLGFKPDGQRRSMLHIHGAWRDHDAFVMTADEAPPSLVDRVLAGRPEAEHRHPAEGRTP